MRLIVLVAACCFTPGLLAQVDSVESVQAKFIQDGYAVGRIIQQDVNAQLDEQIATLNRSIELAESAKIDRKVGRVVFLDQYGELIDSKFVGDAKLMLVPNTKAKRDFIAEKQAEIEAIELKKDTNPKWRPPKMLLKNRMGTIGTLGQLERRFKVIQNLGDGTILAKHAIREFQNLPMVLISGLPNANDLADDTEITLDGYVMCIRTYQYESVGAGVKTIDVLDTCEPSKMEAIIREFVPEEDRKPRVNLPKPKPPNQPEPRVWVDATGKFSVKATFKRSDESAVTITKEDGTEIVIPLDKLSQKDRDWVSKMSN